MLWILQDVKPAFAVPFLHSLEFTCHYKAAVGLINAPSYILYEYCHIIQYFANMMDFNIELVVTVITRFKVHRQHG